MIIAIEGTDGSGKATQVGLLVEYLRENEGLDVVSFSFPMYGTGLFSEQITQYLNGKYGGNDSIPCEMLSILFAGDRFESKNKIIESINNNDVVIFDRYVSSNIAHQGAKIREGDIELFAKWVYSLEYSVFGLPKPDITILLDVDPDISWDLISKKGKRSYTSNKRDVNESDRDYLKKVYNVYRYLSSVSDDWVSIKCSEKGEMLPSSEILRKVIRGGEQFSAWHSRKK